MPLLYAKEVKVIKYDTEEIKPTSRFIEALKELIRAEMEMMQIAEPETADCWTWEFARLTT